MSVDSNRAILSTNHVGKRAWFYFKDFVKQLIARKPMDQLQREIETRNELRRSLNRFLLTAIGVGAIIGAGIVVLGGQAAARYAGPSVIISFLISGIVALLAALSYSELAAMMSHSGAAYTYTYAALGEYLAWFIGWNYALLYQLAALTVVVGWSDYVVDFISRISNYNATRSIIGAPWAWNETGLNFYPTGQAINLPAIAITIAITILLAYGIRSTAIVNLVLVVIKVVILLIFIFAGCKYVNRDNYQPWFPPNNGSFSVFGVTGMLDGCTYVFFAYIGFDAVATIAQEAVTPTAQSVPFAIIASVIISLLIFMGISTVMVGLVSYKLLDTDNPLSIAIDMTPYGDWLPILMDLGAIAALTSVALMMLLSQTRIFYAMANDGLLPKIFAKTYSHTPLRLTIISGIFCAVISAFFPVDVVGKTSTIAALITYIFVHIEVIIMRFTHQDMQRIFRIPCGSWLVPTIGSLLCILLLRGIDKVTAYRFLVWTAIGQIFYFSYGFWHSKRRPPPPRKDSVTSTIDNTSTTEVISMGYTHTESKLDLTNEITENNEEEIYVVYL